VTRESLAAIALCLITALAMVLMVEVHRPDEVQVPLPGPSLPPPPLDEARALPPAEQPQPKQANYAGNTNTHKFHRRGCRYFKCTNCTAMFSTREEAIAAGYRACGTCNP